MQKTKKSAFYERCEKLKSQAARSEYSIYSEYSRLKFNQLCKIYDANLPENNLADIEQNRSQIIAFGCLSLEDEFKKASAKAGKQEEYDAISTFSKQLVEQKWQKKLQTINLLQLIRRIIPQLSVKSV